MGIRQSIKHPRAFIAVTKMTRSTKTNTVMIVTSSQVSMPCSGGAAAHDRRPLHLPREMLVGGLGWSVGAAASGADTEVEERNDRVALAFADGDDCHRYDYCCSYYVRRTEPNCRVSRIKDFLADFQKRREIYDGWLAPLSCGFYYL